MIKRLIFSVALILCLSLNVIAQNKQLTIKLNSKEREYTEDLGYAFLKFEYINEYGNTARVRVTVENITSNPPLAVMIFKNDMTEKKLKKTKPKIEFEKSYPKSNRRVIGFRECNRLINIVPATETDTMFTIDVPFTSPKEFSLPIYEAKYKEKDFWNKAKSLFEKGNESTKLAADKINYKIIKECLYDINIEVINWSEEDPTYVMTKNAVESFISSLDGVKFCYNKRHTPSLKQQKRPYQEKKDSLTQAIKDILGTHPEWFSADPAHVAYSRLLSQLDNVNLNNMTHDCGIHKGKVHSCSYCSLSAEEIYQRLDVLYQQLYAGKIDKDTAMKSAKGLYNCYQQNKKRNKEGSYGAKITRFYNSIANY